MLCYVAVSLAEEFERELLQLSKKEKKRVHKWDEERLRLMKLLVCLCNLQLVQLWEASSPAMIEEFSTFLVSICYKVLENPVTVRDKVLVDVMSELIGLATKKYELTLSKSQNMTVIPKMTLAKFKIFTHVDIGECHIKKIVPF